MVDMNRIVGTHDLLFVVLDTLRHDVAVKMLEEGRTPDLARRLPGGRWEKRHTPGSFTLAAHQAFFAGFLPTPATPGRHPRLFALRFEGSETTAPTTCVLDGPDIVSGLRERGYHTACVGGVGFFNKKNALGRVLPGLFDESHWSDAMGVTDPRSTEHQVACCEEILARATGRLFLYLNVSALHQPNRHYLPGASADSIESHAEALAYVDRHLGRLLDAAARRAPTFAIVCSDHGTAYGDDGFTGHRIAHPSVWDVPYAEMVL
jgi:arylsulfatase A-like enzyme